MNVRVVLIDAHQDARGTLARRLERDARLEVVSHVATVHEAGPLLRDSRPDLILLDVPSHDPSAVECCQQLRELSGVPLVVLVSFMTVEHWELLQAAGAVDYLLKDVDSERFSNAIVCVAGRHKVA